MTKYNVSPRVDNLSLVNFELATPAAPPMWSIRLKGEEAGELSQPADS